MNGANGMGKPSKKCSFDEFVEEVKKESAMPAAMEAHVGETLASLPTRSRRAEGGSRRSAGGLVWSRGPAARRWAVGGVVACLAVTLCLMVGPLQGEVGAADGSGQDSSATIASGLGKAFTVQSAYGLEAAASDNSKLVMTDSGCGEDNFTGLLFKVEGDGIARVSCSIDKGELYRMTRTPLSEEELGAMAGEVTSGDGYTHMVHSMDEEVFCDDFCEVLGSSFTEDYGPEVSYGFYSQADMSEAADLDVDPKQWFHDNIDSFDGATLTVEVAYADGGTAVKSYGLESGRLKCVGDDDRVLQEFTDGEDDPFVYGLLATLKE